MKVCVIQPEYSLDFSRADELFNKKLDLIAQCDESMDIIVLPEDSDVPCASNDREETFLCHKKYIDILLDTCSNTAKRCNAIVFVNAFHKTETGYRNTTYAFGRNGEIIGRYYKKHLPPLEQYTLALDSDYTFEYSEPYVLEYEGIRFGFLTCYDFYFYEAFAKIARQNVDIIIGCSLQRSDSHSALEIMGRFLCYNTNAYLVRASVSLGEDSKICGSSMVVTPKGDVLVNMKSRVGLECAEIDIKDKYYKPAGFGGAMAPHYEYIEFGRHPWQYRHGGSAIVPPDEFMKYPRICAHRGFNKIAPENSMYAFGAAVAAGAQEIELDVWPTADGEIVSIHDCTLDRVSTGTGLVYEKTYAELLEYDFGVKFGEQFKGLKILKLEDILKKLACHTIVNIHIKTRISKPMPISYTDYIQKVIDIVDKCDCRKHVYFMCELDEMLKIAKDLAPDIARCVGWNKDNPWGYVERAVKYYCKKIQLFCEYISKEVINDAHAHGIICNYFYCDDEEKAQYYLDMGVDTILTNNYNNVSKAVKL